MGALLLATATCARADARRVNPPPVPFTLEPSHCSGAIDKATRLCLVLKSLSQMIVR